MSGYGTCTWTCGKCGESYSASGVVGDCKVDRWARDHREMHRVAEMSVEQRAEHYRRKAPFSAWPPRTVGRSEDADPA